MKRLDAGAWKGHQFAGQRIPSFEEALETARGRGRLLIDVNADGLSGLIARSYLRPGIRDEEAFIGAWTSSEITEFARAMPHALILHSAARPTTRLRRLQSEGVGGLGIGEYWPPRFIQGARPAGMVVFAYTVNHEGTRRRLIRMGVDGIETDDPRLAASVCACADAKTQS